MKVIWLEDIVIVQEEGQVEGEPDQGPEHGLPHQQHKVPHVIRDVVNVWRNRISEKSFKVTVILPSIREVTRQHLYRSRESSLKLRRKPEMM